MAISWEDSKVIGSALSTTSFTIEEQAWKLVEAGVSPVNCIKLLGEIHGLGLTESKSIVDRTLDSETRTKTIRLRQELLEQAIGSSEE